MLIKIRTVTSCLLFTGLALVSACDQGSDNEAQTNTANTNKPLVTTAFTPSAYLSFEDSPFNGLSFPDYFHREDFEDHLLNTPGVTVIPATIVTAISSGFSGSIIDSVDADDGVIDNSGTRSGDAGDSLFSGNGNNGITFTFDAEVLGGLPTHAGVVWTDGSGTTSFEAFDADGVSLEVIGPIAIADSNNFGATTEDHFFGMVHPGGISEIHIQNTSGGIEVDHLQYGR